MSDARGESDWMDGEAGSQAGSLDAEAAMEAAEAAEAAEEAAPVPSDLKSLRKLIDQKNKSMVRLLNRRAGYALKIAEVKRAQGLPIRDDAREAQVLEKVSKYNKGPLSDAALHRIFRCIMEEHRRLEEEMEGANGESA
jgi:chorismate mutase